MSVNKGRCTNVCLCLQKVDRYFLRKGGLFQEWMILVPVCRSLFTQVHVMSDARLQF